MTKKNIPFVTNVVFRIFHIHRLLFCICLLHRYLSDGVCRCICHHYILLVCLLRASSPLRRRRDETCMCRPMEDLITEMKERDTIKDKRIKEMKWWKEVITASPAESLITSSRILRNAQSYEETGWRVPFPSNFSLCIWRHSLYPSLHSRWPTHFHELHAGQVPVWDAHLRLLEYSVT